jgi:hypothetical protein
MFGGETRKVWPASVRRRSDRSADDHSESNPKGMSTGFHRDPHRRGEGGRRPGNVAGSRTSPPRAHAQLTRISHLPPFTPSAGPCRPVGAPRESDWSRSPGEVGRSTSSGGAGVPWRVSATRRRCPRDERGARLLILPESSCESWRFPVFLPAARGRRGVTAPPSVGVVRSSVPVPSLWNFRCVRPPLPVCATGPSPIP